MTYEKLTPEQEAEFWAWVEAELSRPHCHNCQHWQPDRIVRGRLRPATCLALAELDRQPPSPDYAKTCRLFYSVTQA